MREGTLGFNVEGVVEELPLGPQVATPEQLEAGPETIDVAVLDDHLPVREGLAPLLAREGIRVVCAAPLSAAGLDVLLCHADRPAIALVSVGTRRAGLPVAQRLGALARGIATVLMTEDPSDIEPAAALAAGAAGVLWKGAPLGVWADGVRAVAQGRLWLEPEPPSAARQPGYTHLSNRERRVLVELARGCTTEEAATTLHVSPHTVRTHVRNIQRKLGARTRVHALALALSLGELDAR